MAYFSGNAFYIRLAKNDTDYFGVCGAGILIDNNTLINNIGTKLTNGGGFSVICTYVNQYTSLQRSSTPVNNFNDSFFNDTDVFGGERSLLDNYIQLNMEDLKI